MITGKDLPELCLQIKPFLSKDNVSPKISSSGKSTPKKVKLILNENTFQKPTINPQHKVSSYKDSPFSLKLIKVVESPTFRDCTKSPHFPENIHAPVSKRDTSSLQKLYKSLLEIIDVDRQLICFKNILGNRNSRIREKQQNTLKELKKVVSPQVLQVTFDEFDPFAKFTSTDFVPSPEQFLEVLKKSDKLFSKLFQDQSLQQIETFFKIMDFNNKGHIDIYDFVRQVTIQTGQPVKPRDLYLAINKLSGNGSKVTLEDLKRHKALNS